MAFHDVRFPVRLSYGSTGGPERRTNVVTLANGFEERNSSWAHSRRRYDAGFGLTSLDDLDALLTFFEERRGKLHAFRWKDWADYRSARPSLATGPFDQVIGTGDGATRRFALEKTYGAGETAYRRPVLLPDENSVSVGIGGAIRNDGWSLSGSEIVFATPPANGLAVTAGFEFDVPVRFDTDRIEISAATFQAGQVPDIPVVEVRL